MAEETRTVAARPMWRSPGRWPTLGILPAQEGAPGGEDAFVRKYDSKGTEVWTRQFGTSTIDGAVSVAADRDGNVYVGGYTFGTFPGQTSSGYEDAFLRKY